MHSQWIQSPVGKFQAVWSPQGTLHSCGFSQAEPPTPQPTTTISPPHIAAHQQLLAERFASYFVDGHLDWNLELLDWTAIPPFHQKVLRACYEIPAGETISYAELATRAGSPRGARAVGSAMARNRWPLLIPCHRVVGANGQLTGYSGTGGIETKRWLLDLESRQLALSM